MTSSRLPGKVMKDVLGKPLLEYQLERLKKSSLANEIVIATTTNAEDDVIVAFCEKQQVEFYRGSELDVLERYYFAAKKHVADIVVRVTSDCPLIDPQVIDQVIQFYLDHCDEFDYVSNSLVRSFPRGMDTEVFSMKLLEEAFLQAKVPYEREHVTPYLYLNPAKYRVGQVTSSADNSHYRWTVDTVEDFELIRRMLSAIYPKQPDFSLDDLLGLLTQHPTWNEINAHISQKKLGE